LNLGASFYSNAVHPKGASPWGMRLQVAFLLPKLTEARERKMMEQKLKQIDQEPKGIECEGTI
jgi:hypothetical protein